MRLEIWRISAVFDGTFFELKMISLNDQKVKLIIFKLKKVLN